ncbi:MAG: hypothetical protein AAFW88_14480, partial [Pseudomonadota bacterium]
MNRAPRTRTDDDRRPRKGRTPEAEHAAAKRIARQLSGLWAGGRTGRTGRRTYTMNIRGRGRRFDDDGKQIDGLDRIIAGLDYAAREGKSARRRDELEAEGGWDRQEMADVLTLIDGKTTRRVNSIALSGIVELPMTDGADPDASKAMRLDIAHGLQDWFNDRDLAVHWAIHSHNDKGEFQPHIHFTATRRPVRVNPMTMEHEVEVAGAKGRAGTPPVLETRAELRAFRHDVAAIVNAAADRRGLMLEGGRWDGGNFTDVDHERVPRANRHVAAQKVVEGKAEIEAQIDRAYDPTQQAAIRAERAAYGAKREAEKAEKQRAKKAQADWERMERLEKLDAVDRTVAADREKHAEDSGRKQAEMTGPAARAIRTLLTRDLGWKNADAEALLERGDVDENLRLLSAKRKGVEALEKQLETAIAA